MATVDTNLPDLRFGLYDTMVAVDHLRGEAGLSANDLMGDGEEQDDDASALAPDPGTSTDRDHAYRDHDPDRQLPSRLPGRRPRALEYIAAGDVFQVNLSQRFAARGRIEPLDLYLRLKGRSPAPFAAFLRWDDLAVVGASPEWFYQTRGDRLVTRPIKGTRPRGRTPRRTHDSPPSCGRAPRTAPS